jgi:hypothetical protein
MFPFSVRYTQKFKKKVPVSVTDEIMTYIKDFFVQKNGVDIVVDGNILTYKSGFFKNRWVHDILLPVDNGSFDLEFQEGDCRLTYEFYMYRLFIIPILMSGYIAISSHNYLFAFISFAVLAFIGWIIVIIRHRLMLGEIIFDIEVLIIEKKENENTFIKAENLNYHLPGAVDWTPEDGEWKPEEENWKPEDGDSENENGNSETENITGN